MTQTSANQTPTPPTTTTPAPTTTDDNTADTTTDTAANTTADTTADSNTDTITDNATTTTPESTPKSTPSAQHAPTPTHFPRFRHLPLELRLMIWELCLPQRIIPLSVLALAHTHLPRHPTTTTSTNTNTTTSTNTSNTTPTTPTSPGTTQGINSLLYRALAEPESPIISQVNREARAVALSRRKGVGELDLAWMGAGSWFDPRTDTLFVDCNVFLRYRVLWRELQRKLLCGTVFGRDSGGGVAVAFGNEVGDWRWVIENNSNGDARGDEEAADGGGVSGDGADDAGLRIRRRAWPVVVEDILLYIGPEDAGRSGLFGLFGEERAVLIELSDERRLARLAGLQVWRGDEGIQRTISRAVECWKNESGLLEEASRALGLDGGEPYPVIKVELVDTRSVPRPPR